jgi:hypothetical protein
LRLKLDGLNPPPAVNEKLVSLGSGLGFVTFLTMMVPRIRFVNVQVTVSPALTSMLLGELPSSQVALVRSQPRDGFSVTL